MDDTQAQLIAEQLGRMRDMISARLDQIEERLEHHKALEVEQVNGIRAELATLKMITGDHETRIRAVNDGVTKFNLLAGLGSGVGFVSGLGAMIKSLFP
jgi:hypothetical protein